MQTGARFDLTGCYRYGLWRIWDESAPRVGFVMLNPSRADAVANDPTIRRCLGFAQSWGYGSLEVANLFAYRTAHPKDLCQVSDPVGVENDAYLRSLAQRVDRTILAWGNWGKLLGRDRTVLQLLVDHPNLYCFGITKIGQPCHPLYLSSQTKLIPFLV